MMTKISEIMDAIPQSQINPIPKNIFMLEEIKDLLIGEYKKTRIAATFKPKLYSAVDFIMPILYAMANQQSIHQACEKLNKDAIAHLEKYTNNKVKKFCDGIRQRRLVPHQTNIDRFLNRFTEEEVQTFFGSLLMTIAEKIRKKEIGSNSVKFLADNTKYPYYGKNTTITEIGSPKLPGTKHARMLQGSSIYGIKLHLFTGFDLIKKGVYRSARVCNNIQWVKWCGFDVNMALLDREFYRARLIYDLKRDHVPGPIINCT